VTTLVLLLHMFFKGISIYIVLIVQCLSTWPQGGYIFWVIALASTKCECFMITRYVGKQLLIFLTSLIQIAIVIYAVLK